MPQALHKPTVDLPSPEARAEDRATLSLLRIQNARCRCLARSDLFQTYTSVVADPVRRAEDLALALLRSFDGEDGMPRLKLFQPTAPEHSFDEDWLLAGLAAAGRRDGDSLRFLLSRRIPLHGRRQVATLLTALADALRSP